MANKNYKKKKTESFFTKLVNLFLSVVLACIIGSSVCTAANNNLRIAQISDVHFTTYENDTSYKMLSKSINLFDDVINQINTSGAYDFVMFTGDLINTPKVSELESFAKHANKIMYPWYATDGNHDISIDGELTKSEFAEVLKRNNSNMSQNKIYYAFTPKKGYRVICLDSIIDYKITTHGIISKEQLAWLENELSSHKKDTVILCTHVPITEPYASPSHKMENEYEVKRIMKSHPNPIIVLQGHYHATKLFQDGNTLYISTPSLVTYPNSFRVININTSKNKVKVDVYLKETNLKEIQTRSKIRLMGTELLYGNESDRNGNFELRREI